MKVIFADAYYWIALINPSDAHHEAAVKAAESLRGTILTTHWVLVEVADALSYPVYRGEVSLFLEELARDEGVGIIGPDERWYQSGVALYRSRLDKSWSLTDCISFVVMQNRGLTEALTGDRHFEQAGFRALLRDA